MNEYDLINDIQELCKDLTKAGKQMQMYGKAYAEAERDYKICLRQHALNLRATQDMPVTLINQVVYGIEEVANMSGVRQGKVFDFLQKMSYNIGEPVIAWIRRSRWLTVGAV